MKAKLGIGLLILAVLIISLVTACTETTPPATSTETTSPATSAATQPPTSETTAPSTTSNEAPSNATTAVPGQTYQWRLAMPGANLGVNSYDGVAAWGCQEIGLVSGGRLSVERVIASTFGMNNNNSIQLLSNGVVESAIISQASEIEIPILGVMAWPGLMPSYNRHLQISILDALTPYFEEAFAEKNLIIIGTTLQTRRQLFMSETIESIEDLRGAKIRVSSTADGLVAQALGASPLSIPFPETEMALRQGTIDGLITGTEALPMINITDAIKTAVLLNTGGAPNFWVVSKEHWDMLPADLQKIMREVAAEAYSSATVASEVEEFRALWKYQTDSSWTILNITPANEAAIKEAGLGKISELYTKTGPVGQDMVKVIEETIAAAQ